MKARDGISTAAKRAVEKYERIDWTLGGGIVGHAFANWNDSVNPFFVEFIKAVRDKPRPVPTGYFECGLGMPENPIVAFPYSKAIHCLVMEFPRMDAATKARVKDELLEPFMAKWEELLSALESRFDVRQELVDVRDRLQAIYNSVASLWYGGTGIAENYYSTFNDFQRAFNALGEAVRRCGDRRSGAATGIPEEDRAAAKDYLRTIARRVKCDLGKRSLREAVRYILAASPGDPLFEDCARVRKIARKWHWCESTMIKEAKPASAVKHAKGIPTAQTVARNRNRARVAHDLPRGEAI